MSDLTTLAIDVLDDHGRELWRQPARFEGYLRDYAGQRMRFHDEENALQLAILRDGCLTFLAPSDNQVSAETQRQVTEAFARKQGASPASVEAALTAWAGVIGFKLHQVFYDSESAAKLPQTINLAPRAVPPQYPPPPKLHKTGDPPPGNSYLMHDHRPSARSNEPSRKARTEWVGQSRVSTLDILVDAPSHGLIFLAMEVSGCFLLYMLVILIPLAFLTYGLLHTLHLGTPMLPYYIPAVSLASWIAFRFGKAHCKRIFISRVKKLLDP